VVYSVEQKTGVDVKKYLECFEGDHELSQTWLDARPIVSHVLQCRVMQQLSTTQYHQRLNLHNYMYSVSTKKRPPQV